MAGFRTFAGTCSGDKVAPTGVVRAHCLAISLPRAMSTGKMTLPRVQLIIPTWRKEPFDDPEWAFDFKYDGFRALCYVERGRSRLISRNGILSRFDALADQLAAMLAVDNAILDGEVIAADETGRPQFYDLIRRTRTPAYVAFDVDLRSLPLGERRKRLQAMLPAPSPIISEAAVRHRPRPRTLRNLCVRTT